MSNVWYAVDEKGATVAEFLSRDYDALDLAERFGRVHVFDRSDGDRFVETAGPLPHALTGAFSCTPHSVAEPRPTIHSSWQRPWSR